MLKAFVLILFLIFVSNVYSQQAIPLKEVRVFQKTMQLITGYTLGGIERDFLKHTYGISSLSRELKNHKPAGITDNQIDIFINNFSF